MQENYKCGQEKKINQAMYISKLKVLFEFSSPSIYPTTYCHQDQNNPQLKNGGWEERKKEKKEKTEHILWPNNFKG